MSYWDVPLTHQNLVHMFPNSYFDLIYLSLMIGLLGEFSDWGNFLRLTLGRIGRKKVAMNQMEVAKKHWGCLQKTLG